MPCNYSTIGLSAESSEEIDALMESVYQQAQTIECNKVSYRKWHANGAEVWLHIGDNGEIKGMTPSFFGKSKVDVGITGLVAGDSNSEFEVSLHCWAEPNSNADHGAYPFIFELVNKAQYRNLEFPFFTTATISAFAHHIEVYQDERDFEQSQIQNIPFAAKSFIPSGLFMGEDQGIPPLAVATFSGEVIEHQVITNELSGKSFQWILVDTLGGIFDVVADEELISRDIEVGNIISGTFGLIGQIALEPQQRPSLKKGFLSRLFNR
ncbi:hypothetical protein MHM98_11445 [Psychrobium sp. MM17-31]|uniref:hypothetical protein n=1 Tax=Psychrobium sp. MM17-31 TaxID=2917758 RepID=UPI001EF6E0F1|nr:hypothetical protein [Psychrobium sp. MM17-31]MCG7531951.1 hypothetical protein [Psychrobium sp. MM17-31]